jgi:hypothetical protein
MNNRKIKLQIITKSEKAFEFTDFKITFTINKGLKNNCTTTITNLNPETRNILTDNANYFRIFAGRNNESLSLLFEGDIFYLDHNIGTVDIITNIESEDGLTFKNNSKMSISYSEKATLSQVLKDIAKKTGLPLSVQTSALNFIDIKLNNGFSGNGNTTKILDNVCNDANLDWSIQNGKLKLLEKNGTDKKLCYNLNSKNGLIGFPEKIKLQKDKSNDKIKNKILFGWKIKSLLIPNVEFGSIIQVSSKEIGENKQFKILEIVHTGDNTPEGDFLTELTLESL